MRVMLTGATMRQWRGFVTIAAGEVVEMPEDQATKLMGKYPLDFVDADAPNSAAVDVARLRDTSADIRVGVVVTTFNGLAMTSRCIGSLQPVNGIDLEVYVVDNCSTDGTVEWLTANGIAFEQPVGRCSVAAALNRGSAYFSNRESPPKYLLVCNNDVEIPVGYVRTLVDFMDGNVRAGWVTGYAGQIDHAVPVPIAGEMISGDCSAVLLRSIALRDVGPWDERFTPRYSEDEDLLTRFELAGWECWRMPLVYGGKSGGYVASNPGEIGQVESYKRSLNIYLDKWGDCPRSAKRYTGVAPEIIGTYPCRGYAPRYGTDHPVPVVLSGKRAAIIQGGHAGDLMLSFPFASELKARGYFVRWYAVEPFASMARLCPDVDEVFDSGTLPVSVPIGQSFQNAFRPALDHARKEGFDVVLTPQISPDYQSEFLRSNLPYLPFMRAVCGVRPVSSRPKLVGEPTESRRDRIQYWKPDDRPAVMLNFAADSVPILIDWRWWSGVIDLLRELVPDVRVVYSETHRMPWRGTAAVERMGRLNPGTLPYLAADFDLVITSSSLPWVSSLAMNVPCVTLITPETGGYSGLFEKYATLYQGLEWESVDLVWNDSTRRPRDYDAAGFCSMVAQRLHGQIDLRTVAR